MPSDSLEFTRQQDSFFSIDGGETALAEFTSGIYETEQGLQGYQASHWNNLGDGRADPLVEERQEPRVDDAIAELLGFALAATPEDEVIDASELLQDPQTIFDNAQISTVTGIGQRGQTSIGVMDPTLAPGEWSEISELDLLALDVLGFDRNTQQGAIDYAQIRSDVENDLAARFGLDREQLSENTNQVAQLLARDRRQEVENTVELNDLLERRQRRQLRRKASFWQENDADPLKLSIISDGAGADASVAGHFDNRRHYASGSLCENATDFADGEFRWRCE